MCPQWYCKTKGKGLQGSRTVQINLEDKSYWHKCYPSTSNNLQFTNLIDIYCLNLHFLIIGANCAENYQKKDH